MSRLAAGTVTPPGDQAGFALVELIVAMALMSLLALAGYTSVDSFTKASKESQQRSDALAEARTALEIVLRDLRAANPIVPVDPVSQYDTAVAFSVYCSTPGVDGCNTENARQVSYAVSGNELRRTAQGVTTALLRPTPSTEYPLALQAGAVVNTASQPVFTYYDLSGARLETQGVDAVASTKFRDCARSVRIHLVVLTVPGDANSTVELVSKVDLRNFSEVSQCAV